MRTRRTEGQSGFLMAALSELMRAAASAGRINIISSILWLPVAYLWPGFCALGANNASKKQRSGSRLPQPLQSHIKRSAPGPAPDNCTPIVPNVQPKQRTKEKMEAERGLHNESTTAE